MFVESTRRERTENGYCGTNSHVLYLRQIMTFGEILRLWREHKGVSQEELGRRAGMSANSISFLERGERKPRNSTRRVLADALGIKPEELAHPPDTGKPNPEKTLKEFDALYLDGMLTEEEVQDRLYRLRKMRRERGLDRS